MATTKSTGTKTKEVLTPASKKTSTKEATKNSLKASITKKPDDKKVKSPKEDIKAETKKVIKKEASIRKYKGIDYDDPNTTDKMKKEHRTKIRTKLHRFVSDFSIAKKTGKNVKEKTMPIFKGFRQFLVAEFNLKLDNCENAFKGTSVEKVEDYTEFMKDFKAYLKERKAAKATA